MLIEDVTDSISTRDAWFPSDAASVWNGRAVSLMHESSLPFEPLLCADTNTKSSVSSDVSAKTDTQGNSSVSGSVQYQVQSRDDKGNSSSVAVEAKGTVDNKGQASGEAKVTFSKEF